MSFLEMKLNKAQIYITVKLLHYSNAVSCKCVDTCTSNCYHCQKQKANAVVHDS